MFCVLTIGMPCSYSGHSEILRYFKGVATKHGLYDYIRLSHKVTNAVWDENGKIWKVEVQDVKTNEVLQDWCHVLLNGCGVLKCVAPRANPSRLKTRKETDRNHRGKQVEMA